jgi:hypothetical protein
MARRSTAAKQAYGDPVYTWAFRSSKPYGGTFVTHETRLEQDGTLRCGCMGWLIQKKNTDGTAKPRSCKHTKQVEAEGEVKEIMRKFRAGEELPIFEDPNAPRTHQIPGIASPAPTTDRSNIKYGRLIQLD